jgi:hypothetical protein
MPIKKERALPQLEEAFAPRPFIGTVERARDRHDDADIMAGAAYAVTR